MGMVSKSRLLLVAAVITLAVVDALLIVALLKPSVVSPIVNGVKGAVRTALSTTYKLELMSQGVASLPQEPIKPQPLALPATAYVVGPSQFINGLISAGAPQSMIRPITLSNLVSVPNDSIVVIDWDYINESMHVTLNQLAKLLEGVIGRGDLIILYTESPRWVLPLEDAIVVAWGNHYHSTVIGYPVTAVNASTYVMAFGGRNYLVINPVQVRYDYTAAINELIRYWVLVNKVPTSNTYLANLDPTYYDQDECGELLTQIQSQHLNQWFFEYGPGLDQGSQTGNQYKYDYCIFGVYQPAGQPAYIPVEYLGFNNLEASSSGGNWVSYVVGINMTTAYYIDQENGYNSYMTWTGTGAEPGSTSCSWFPPTTSVLELVLEIAQEAFEFIYDVALASDLSNPVYSLTASLSTVGPGPEGTANLVWSIGIENQNWFCTPVSTQAGYYYPVGFGVVNSQGEWYVNPNTVNTAASPVFYGEGPICYPLTRGNNVENFGSHVYSIFK